MRSLSRYAARLVNRLTRPVVVVLLVFAQCVAAFGYPVVVRAGESVRRCGCKVRGPSQACCCGPQSCCSSTSEQPPAPEPEVPACPKCKVKSTAKPQRTVAQGESASVTWIPGMKARQCRGDGSLGFIAEFPAVPPVVSPQVPTHPVAVGTISERDDHLVTHTFRPPDPPPRRG